MASRSYWWTSHQWKSGEKGTIKMRTVCSSGCPWVCAQRGVFAWGYLSGGCVSAQGRCVSAQGVFAQRGCLSRGCLPATSPSCEQNADTYVSLRLRMQDRRKKWNFPLNFRTMHKLSDLYSGIFQTQSSGCASGVDYFRNFTKLKNLNF